MGLRRHAARDRGFFRLACDMFCDTVRRQAELAANRDEDDKGCDEMLFYLNKKTKSRICEET